MLMNPRIYWVLDTLDRKYFLWVLLTFGIRWIQLRLTQIGSIVGGERVRSHNSSSSHLHLPFFTNSIPTFWNLYMLLIVTARIWRVMDTSPLLDKKYFLWVYRRRLMYLFHFWTFTETLTHLAGCISATLKFDVFTVLLWITAFHHFGTCTYIAYDDFTDMSGTFYVFFWYTLNTVVFHTTL